MCVCHKKSQIQVRIAEASLLRACTFESVSALICFRSETLGRARAFLSCSVLIYIYRRDMTLQFVAGVVATFTIIFLLGRFCMSWQIFIGYRSIIGSAHNRPHKAPCHTVVGRPMPRPGPASSFCATRARARILR